MAVMRATNRSIGICARKLIPKPRGSRGNIVCFVQFPHLGRLALHGARVIIIGACVTTSGSGVVKRECSLLHHIDVKTCATGVECGGSQLNVMCQCHICKFLCARNDVNSEWAQLNES